ncbi:hypothetical protein SPACI_045290 [Sporomusa acidovorans DSM 3132]|uniref:Uncharacterized protein n=1 Tax=Sporomusa acidovorans (strain ATCC 49682 / DSM 3132 / Mol) TaxID=1123286 RepID=A0ABZ3J7P6_SPOA4|nr:hypothetical protein SPACI_41620 [Sporomusa acidovorans DSM 3132]SDE05877.1 hypothetical protein SAMN04488499_100760 [Sporomusa acidovorans]
MLLPCKKQFGQNKNWILEHIKSPVFDPAQTYRCLLAFPFGKSTIRISQE